MNAAYFHITLVHTPIILTPLAAVLLAFAHLRKSMALAQTALVILIAASVLTVSAFCLGEPAEEVVEHLAGISKHTIEEHEEAAEVTLWFGVATGILAVFSLALISIGSSLQRRILTLTFLTTVLTSIALAYTGHEGGKIRHPEAFSSLSDINEHDHDDKMSSHGK